jgi:hypothetical protein
LASVIGNWCDRRQLRRLFSAHPRARKAHKYARHRYLQRGDDVADIDGRNMSSAWLALASMGRATASDATTWRVARLSKATKTSARLTTAHPDIIAAITVDNCGGARQQPVSIGWG